MHEVITELSSIRWWISVVLAGILINLLSTYLKPQLDKAASKLSLKGKIKLKSMREAETLYLNKLRSDKDFRVLETFEELRFRARSTHMLLMGVFILSMVNLIELNLKERMFFLGFAGATFFISYLFYEKAARKISKIRKATEQ